MTDLDKLKALIETVDPDDTDKLDEIDARVWCYIDKTKHLLHTDGHATTINWKGDNITYYSNFIPKYTRSRDALKAIRPDIFSPVCLRYNQIMSLWEFQLFAFGYNYKITSPFLPTEELAELHAIIQAIAWEREQDGK